MNQNIPENVKKILMTLTDNGYDGYVVGGAVRDYVMGNEPHDWDIATNAKPEQVKSLFRRTLDTGIKHGTVTAKIGDEGYEITTYRCDGLYSDGRHPDSVEFVDRIEDDLARRDFTINAMAMDVNGNIVDPFGGLDDIKRGVIRCVGNPDDRFSEDALRMMRAVRFESKFGFELDSETKEAIVRNADGLKNVSAERVCDEFTKILVSANPKKGFIDAYKTGITKQVLPEFDRMMECEQNTPYHYANVGIHTLDAVENIRPDPVLRWTMLLHDAGKPVTKEHDRGRDTFYGHPSASKEIADDVMRRLRFSNKERMIIDSFIENHDLTMTKPHKIRKFAGIHGADYVENLCEVKMADAKAHAPKYQAVIMQEHMAFIDKCRIYIADGTAIKQSDLNINGYVLQRHGIHGEAIGKFMKQAYETCLAQPELNTREALLKMADKQVERHGQRVSAAEHLLPSSNDVIDAKIFDK